MPVASHKQAAKSGRWDNDGDWTVIAGGGWFSRPRIFHADWDERGYRDYIADCNGGANALDAGGRMLRWPFIFLGPHSTPNRAAAPRVDHSTAPPPD